MCETRSNILHRRICSELFHWESSQLRFECGRRHPIHLTWGAQKHWNDSISVPVLTLMHSPGLLKPKLKASPVQPAFWNKTTVWPEVDTIYEVQFSIVSETPSRRYEPRTSAFQRRGHTFRRRGRCRPRFHRKRYH
jgi:hypothetical protein